VYGGFLQKHQFFLKKNDFLKRSIEPTGILFFYQALPYLYISQVNVSSLS